MVREPRDRTGRAAAQLTRRPFRRRHGAASVPATQSHRSPPPRCRQALGSHVAPDRRAPRRRGPDRADRGDVGPAPSAELAAGALGTPATVVLRMLVLKHLSDWSFDECEREVRGSLVYRAFCRIDGERVPDAKTLIRLSHLLDEAVLKAVLARVVGLARQQRVVRGQRLRVDTTVVETNIHYPTDSTLLADGVRVLTRTMRQLGERVRNRTRSVARRVFEIAQRSRTTGNRAPPGRAGREPRPDEGALPRAAAHHAAGGPRRPRRGGPPAGPAAAADAPPRRAPAGDDRDRAARGGPDPRPRPARRHALSRARCVSVFEPHTQIIRKGKLAKPTEFGCVVKIQEAEAPVHHRLRGVRARAIRPRSLGAGARTTRRAVRPSAPARGGRWRVCLAHERTLGAGARGPPRRLAAAAERTALARGAGGPAVADRQRRTHQRVETLSWAPSMPIPGAAGMQRWVGLGVIANNLTAIARARTG